MSNNSAIEWTDATWNPVTGCSKVSEGCRNCYALKFAERFRGTPGHYFEYGFDVMLRHQKLDLPLGWKKPRRVFVNSMSDLFHEQVPFEFIRSVWARMAITREHTFQVLTKRPQRAVDFFAWMEHQEFRVEGSLPNVWLGVSVENQQAADERIPLLLQTPAVVRFLSCEPLLGPVRLDGYWREEGQGTYSVWIDHLDWVIVGGESGPNARPMHPDWVRDLRGQCNIHEVPFFFKQWGEWLPMFEQPWEDTPTGTCRIINREGGSGFHGDGAMWTKRVGKKAAGRQLDGRTWDEFPVVQ